MSQYITQLPLDLVQACDLQAAVLQTKKKKAEIKRASDYAGSGVYAAERKRKEAEAERLLDAAAHCGIDVDAVISEPDETASTPDMAARASDGAEANA